MWDLWSMRAILVIFHAATSGNIMLRVSLTDTHQSLVANPSAVSHWHVTSD